MARMMAHLGIILGEITKHSASFMLSKETEL
jgi:hypothetical protein